MTFWPILLGLYAFAALFNWRAGLAFVFVLALVRVVKELTPFSDETFDQILFFAIYSCIGALCFLLWDRASGATFAACGLLYAAHVFGWIGHEPKMKVADGILVAGVVLSIFTGSGGLLAGHRHPDSARSVHPDLGLAVAKKGGGEDLGKAEGDR